MPGFHSPTGRVNEREKPCYPFVINFSTKRKLSLVRGSQSHVVGRITLNFSCVVVCVRQQVVFHYNLLNKIEEEKKLSRTFGRTWFHKAKTNYFLRRYNSCFEWLIEGKQFKNYRWDEVSEWSLNSTNLSFRFLCRVRFCWNWNVIGNSIHH